MQSNQLVNFANEFDFMPNLVLITIAKKRHSGAIYEAMKTEHSVTPALDNVAYSSLSLITNSRTVNYFLVYRVNSFNFPGVGHKIFLRLFIFPAYIFPSSTLR